MNANPRFGSIFDADHHYWEPSDAFTRYRDPKFRDRGLRVVEHEGQLRYFVGDKLFNYLPGPGDVHGRPRPGSMFDYFAGREGFDPIKHAYDVPPAEHPEWFNREARLKVMDEQGVEACWMFPTHGVCLEGSMQPDIEGSLATIGAFNRWIEEEWGFAWQNRIFGVPLMSLSDPEAAVRDLEWALAKGARVIAMRNGPVYTAHGNKSPADPMFDAFWARVEEAQVVLTAQAGFNDGYKLVDNAVAQSWGIDFDRDNISFNKALGYDQRLVDMLQKKRLVHDFAAVLVTHGLFERFPRLRFAFVENGAYWVGPLLHDLHVVHMQNPGMFKTNPVDQFQRNVWITPFVEDDPQEVARHMPVERIIYGSDWPHSEGMAQPSDYYASLSGFSDADVGKIMRENARALTFV